MISSTATWLALPESQKLEKQLQFEKDRNYALNTLIDIAEEQGIKIRKKSGVKR